MAVDEAKKNQASSDDWLKVLSLLALISKNAPDDRDASAVAVAFTILALSIYSRAVFTCLHFAATAFLGWLALQSQQWEFAGYAAFYACLGIVFVAEGEQRRVGRGQLLSAVWWAGQLALYVMDIRHAYAAGGASGFFTDLFCGISAVMVVVELYRGGRDLIARRRRPRERSSIQQNDSEQRKAA